MLFEAHLLPWPRLRRPSRRRPRKVEKRRDGQPHLGGRDESLPKKLEHRDVHEIFCVLCGFERQSGHLGLWVRVRE